MTIEEWKTCNLCGNSILRISKWSTKQWERKKFCSVNCQRKGRIFHHNPAWNRGLKTAKPNKCDVCSNISFKVCFYKKFSKVLCGKHYWQLRKTGKVLWGDNRPTITPLTRRIRHSKKNVNWRRRIYRRDDYTCQLCGERGGKLEADHFPVKFSTIFRKFNIKTFEQAMQCKAFWQIKNGRTLCVKCHRGEKSYSL